MPNGQESIGFAADSLEGILLLRPTRLTRGDLL
jgi:hypothetical protein